MDQSAETDEDTKRVAGIKPPRITIDVTANAAGKNTPSKNNSGSNSSSNSSNSSSGKNSNQVHPMTTLSTDDNAGVIITGSNESSRQSSREPSAVVSSSEMLSFVRDRVDGEMTSGFRRAADERDVIEFEADRADERHHRHSPKPSSAGLDDDPLTQFDRERYESAYAKILDAFAGRNKHGIMYVKERGRLPWLFFNLRRSKVYSVLFFCVVWYHIVATYFEDRRYPYFYIVEAFPIVFYALDVVMKASHMSIMSYFSKRWNKIEVGFIILFIADYVLVLLRYPAPFRCLRPWIYLCKEKELRRFFQALVAVKWSIAKIVLTVSVMIGFFATIGVYLFDNTYQRFCEEESNIDLGGAFDNVLIAWVHIMTLSTTENYPEVMMPTFRQRWASIIFFGLFLIFALFYVLPVSLALVNDRFWHAQGLQFKQDRKKERRTLIEAFNLLDVDTSGYITRDQWLEFMSVVKPTQAQSVHQLMFTIASGGNDVMDWKQFLEIRKVLRARLKQKRFNIRPVEEKWKRFQDRCRNFIDSRAWHAVVVSLIGIFWLLSCLHWQGLASSSTTAIRIVQSAMLGIFTVELWLKWYVRGWRFGRGEVVFSFSIDLVEYFFVFTSVVFMVLYWVNAFDQGPSVAIFTACQALRLTYRIHGNLEFLKIFESILAVSSKLLFIIVFSLFSFSVITYELYQDQPAVSPFYCAETFDQDHCAIVSNSTLGNFGSLTCSSFVSFQLFTTSNWHEIMSQVSQAGTRWDSLPFIVLYLFLQIVLMSLMIGTSIEAFFLVRDRKSKEKKQELEANKKANRQRADSVRRKRTGGIWGHVRGVLNAVPWSRSINSPPTTVTRVEVEMKDDTTKSRRKLVDKINERRKKAREGKKKGSLPSRCVAIVNEKMHGDNDLLLRKGDIIDILEHKESRYKGRCHGKVGWFDAQCVLLVLDEELMKKFYPHMTNAAKNPAANTQADRRITDEYEIEDRGVTRGDLVSSKVTNMNPDELIELNRLAKSDLLIKNTLSRKRKFRKSQRNASITGGDDGDGTQTMQIGDGSYRSSRRASTSTRLGAIAEDASPSRSASVKRSPSYAGKTVAHGVSDVTDDVDGGHEGSRPLHSASITEDGGHDLNASNTSSNMINYYTYEDGNIRAHGDVVKNLYKKPHKSSLRGTHSNTSSPTPDRLQVQPSPKNEVAGKVSASSSRPSTGSSRKVLFDDAAKKIDGSEKDQMKLEEKEKLKKEGTMPDWVKKMAESKNIQLSLFSKKIDDAKAKSRSSDTPHKGDDGSKAATADGGLKVGRRKSVRERPKTPIISQKEGTQASDESGTASSRPLSSHSASPTPRARSARKEEMRRKMEERRRLNASRRQKQQATTVSAADKNDDSSGMKVNISFNISEHNDDDDDDDADADVREGDGDDPVVSQNVRASATSRDSCRSGNTSPVPDFTSLVKNKPEAVTPKASVDAGQRKRSSGTLLSSATDLLSQLKSAGLSAFRGSKSSQPSSRADGAKEDPDSRSHRLSPKHDKGATRNSSTGATHGSGDSRSPSPSPSWSRRDLRSPSPQGRHARHTEQEKQQQKKKMAKEDESSSTGVDLAAMIELEAQRLASESK